LIYNYYTHIIISRSTNCDSLLLKIDNCQYNTRL